MGKRIVNVLTVCLVLLFALSSCSLDSALDALRGNKYIEWGWTEADTTNVNAVNDAITNIKPEKTDGLVNEDGNELDLSNVDKDSGLYAIKQATDALKSATGSQTDITITLTDDQKTAVEKGVLATMTGDEKDNFMANINSSLNGAQRDVFVKTMQEAADDSQQDAAKGSMALASAMISTVTTSLGDMANENEAVQGILGSLSTLQTSLNSKVTGEGNITKADVVQTQMITNLVATAAQVASEMKTNQNANPLELDSVNTLINDAVTLSNTSKALSGDFDIISDMLGSIMGLIPSGDSSSGTEGEPATRSFARTAGDKTGDKTKDGTPTTNGPELVYVSLNSDGTVSESEEDGEGRIAVYKAGPILYHDEKYEDEASKAEMLRIFNASMEAVGDGLEGLFGATKVNGIYQVNKKVFNSRIEAYRMLSSAYDIIYSVVPERKNGTSYSEYSFLIDQYKATPNSAIDYALATVLSNLFALVDDKAIDTFNFVDTLNEFLSINPWISNPDKAVVNDTYMYYQKSLLDAFGLDINKLATETGWSYLFEIFFSGNVGFDNSLEVNPLSTPSEGDVDDMLYYKAGVLDKMMAVGGFDLETILGMFQVDTGDSGEMEFTSMKDAVKQLYLNMWNEYSQLEDHDSSLRPNILDKNN